MTSIDKKQNIPDGWRDIVASTILDVRDGTHGTPARVANGIPLITSKNIINGDLDINDAYSVSIEDVEQINKRSKVEKGDIIISMIGTVGECALLKTQPNFVVKNVGIFKKNEDNVIPEYLIKYLHSHISQHRVRSRSNGGIQKFISLGDLRKLKLLLPSLPEQNRIVFILDIWDQVIEKLKRKIEIKKNIKKGLMQELLGGRKRITGFEEEWKQVFVGEIFKFVRTYSVSRDKLANMISGVKMVGNIHYGDLHTKFFTEIDLSVDEIPQMKDLGFKAISEDYLQDGDLIMADASEDYEGIGVTVSVHNIQDKKVVGGLHTFVLRDLNSKTSEKYRQFIFKNKDVKKRIKQIANGVSVYGISKSNISKILISLPSKQEQSAIADVLTKSDKEIKFLTRKLSILKDQKKHLLNNLITGTIRTTETLLIPK